MSSAPASGQAETFLGHPPGLFTLFFAEMWERFSYYGMRALLLFYMIKGFLRYGDSDAYAVYGAYTALVYMTPFFGGMLADRVLGARKAVIFGAVLMTAGQLCLTIPTQFAFFTGLSVLVLGNGFFKPNISSIIGKLYPPGSIKRDGGFTIFYMGINLGAAMSPLVCGYIGETYGWNYGFGLAALGMLAGLVVFVNWLPPGDVGRPHDLTLLGRRPIAVSQAIVAVGACLAAAALVYFHPVNVFSTAVNVFVAVALLVAAGISCAAMRKDTGGLINVEWSVYLATLVFVPVFVLLVSGFAPLTEDQRGVVLVGENVVKGLKAGGPLSRIAATVVSEASRPAGLVLILAGVVALGYLAFETFRQPKIARERLFVVLTLTFFYMVFGAFFEQAGSSINNFTDRNVDRVLEERNITPSDVGTTIRFRVPLTTDDPELADLPLLTQEQIGRQNGHPDMQKRVAEAIRAVESRKEVKNEKVERLIASLDREKVLSMTTLTYLRDGANVAGPDERTLDWLVVEDNVGMGVGGTETPASAFQAANPVYILLVGLLFSALWTWLGARGWEPSTTVKFALGLLQLGLGFGALWYGATLGDSRGMTTVFWLLLGYLLHTTGELCISPVGLSMITRLTPAKLVSTVMGTWFLALAFSQFLAAIIAQFTGATESETGGSVIPLPTETLNVYGEVFGPVAVGAVVSGVICFLLSPLLNRWMHTETEGDASS